MFRRPTAIVPIAMSLAALTVVLGYAAVFGTAAVAVAPWRVVYRAVDVPEPGPEDVVIRVLHSWISNGTEGSFVRGERGSPRTPPA